MAIPVKSTHDEAPRTTVVKLREEVLKIADEIESLLDIQAGAYSKDDFLKLQQIDLCSQKLKDIASMIEVFDLSSGVSDAERSARMRSVVKLEYFQKLLQAPPKDPPQSPE